MVRMVEASRLTAWAMFSSTVFPVTVIRLPSMSPLSASCFITAGTPPAALKSWMWVGPAGARWHRLGTTALTSLKVSRLTGASASLAMASRCSTLLVEQPRAISVATAFLKAAGVRISRGQMFFFTSSMICIPECLASWMRPLCTAGIVPLPGRAMPMASLRQFMELAVYIPEQLPQPGQQSVSYCLSSSPSMNPAL